MKYEIEHACGHIHTYHLYGSGKERASREQWLASQDCPDCKRERENQRSAAAAKEAGRPELTGSEKQVAWANTIREKAIDAISSECTTVKMRRLSSVLSIATEGTCKKDAVDTVYTMIERRLRQQLKEQQLILDAAKEIAAKLGEDRTATVAAMLLDAVNEITDAKTWIDNRNDVVGMLADMVAVKLIGNDVDKAPQTLQEDQFGRCKNGAYYLRTHGFAESTDQDINAELAFVDADDVTDNGDGTITIAGDVLQAAIDRAGARTSAIYGTFCNVYLNKSKK